MHANCLKIFLKIIKTTLLAWQVIKNIEHTTVVYHTMILFPINGWWWISFYCTFDFVILSLDGVLVCRSVLESNWHYAFQTQRNAKELVFRDEWVDPSLSQTTGNGNKLARFRTLGS